MPGDITSIKRSATLSKMASRGPNEGSQSKAQAAQRMLDHKSFFVVSRTLQDAVRKAGASLGNRTKKLNKQADHQGRRRSSIVPNLFGVWMAGGHEQWASDIMLSALDADNDGEVGDSELQSFVEMGERIVDANQSFALNAGVVSALLLSVLYPVAFSSATQIRDVTWTAPSIESDTALQPPPTNGPALFTLQTLSFLLLHTAIALAFTLLAVSARIYTQISFWMPNLESQLWYAQTVADTLAVLEAVKSACLLLSIASLFMYAVVHAAWVGMFTLLPLTVSVWFYARFEARFSRLCTEQLHKQTKELAERREKKKVCRQSMRSSQPGQSTNATFSAASYEPDRGPSAVSWGAEESVSLQA